MRCLNQGHPSCVLVRCEKDDAFRCMLLSSCCHCPCQASTQASERVNCINAQWFRSWILNTTSPLQQGPVNQVRPKMQHGACKLAFLTCSSISKAQCPSTCHRCIGLRRYGWLRHDGRTFGEQELLDGPLNITTTLVQPLLTH